jgi:hypothetical protein
MDRRPTTQDITWLLDLDRNTQLDLDPPYQRRSVWTKKDRQFFLDTIFRNFPSPAIFLHKSINEDGASTYHVVDGKQRLQTILQFVKGGLRIAKDYGDVRLDGKKWDDLVGDTEFKRRFWNYQITVEMLDEQQVAMVRDVFDRLNRNARRLTRQELRHAKFDGWLITTAEDDSEREEWKELGVTTRARSARMTDSQFISELMLVVLEKTVLGFDQDVLDNLYAKYDDLDDELEDFSKDDFRDQYAGTKAVLLAMERKRDRVTQRHYGGVNSLVSTRKQLIPEIRQGASFSIGTDELPKFPAVDREVAAAAGRGTEFRRDRPAGCDGWRRIYVAAMHECAIRRQPGLDALAGVNSKYRCWGTDETVIDEVRDDDRQRLGVR